MPQSHSQTQYSQQSQLIQPTTIPNTVDLVALYRDVDSLVAGARHDFARNISDAGVQNKLKALLDLKTILDGHQNGSRPLPESQLRQIRDHVSNMAPTPQPIPRPTPPPAPLPAHVVKPTPPPHPPSQQPTPQPAIPSFINSANLAELLRTTASRNQPTPPPSSLPEVVKSPPIAHATPIQAAPPDNPLIAQLRAAGLLPATGTPPAGLQLPFTSPSALLPIQSPAAIPPTADHLTVKLTIPFIKQPRLNLIANLYDELSNRCTTCGRRFTADAKGRNQKASHLDWHFKTNTRLAEAAKRGQSRSWYVDEREWISSREYEDGVGPPEAADGASTTGAAKQVEHFIPVPNDAVLRNAPCPICQEKFESTWSEDVQEFIWRDAMKVGNRVYHASCYREATKDKESTPMGGGLGRTATPDSVLGKRKAEVSF